MASTTPNLGLHKSAGSEFVNVTEDLNNNWDTVDTFINDIGKGGRWVESSTQTVNSYNPEKLVIDNEIWSRGGIVSRPSNTDFTFNKDGIWLVSFGCHSDDITEDSSRPDNSHYDVFLKDASDDSTLRRISVPAEHEGYELSDVSTMVVSGSLTIYIEVNAQSEASSFEVGGKHVDLVWLRP